MISYKSVVKKGRLGIALYIYLKKNMYALINLKWSIFQQQDNMSDSSGEITTSDSGRGGSDLDLSLHLSKSGKLLHVVQVVF